MRTIDADAFDATMYEAWKNNEVTNEEWVHFREMIKDEPTIEPQRMRGRWVDDGQHSDNFPHHAWRCSECGESVIEIDTPWYRYCPNCGAEMGEQDVNH